MSGITGVALTLVGCVAVFLERSTATILHNALKCFFAVGHAKHGATPKACSTGFGSGQSGAWGNPNKRAAQGIYLRIACLRYRNEIIIGTNCRTPCNHRERAAKCSDKNLLIRGESAHPGISDLEKVPIKMQLLQPGQSFERFFIRHSIPCEI